jgi:hypothetical protein
MTATGLIQDGVRFVPSRVEGAPGGAVAEAVVYRDRLELRDEAGEWSKVPFNTFAPQPEPPTVFGRFLPGRAKRPPVAAVSFSCDRYADSFIRFLSHPAVTLYMPAEGPTRFPESVFSHVLRVLAAGGHRFYDVGSPPPGPAAYERLPRGARAVVDGVMLLCAVNFLAFVVLTLCLRGNALLEGRVRDGHHYLGKPHREREVSRMVWNLSWWHGVATVATLPALAVVGFATDAYVKRQDRRAKGTT